jgi:hypothetical protein
MPTLLQHSLGGGTQECILTDGIIPGGRVFYCQGSAEEIHLLPLTPEKTVGREPRENEKAWNSFLRLEK